MTDTRAADSASNRAAVVLALTLPGDTVLYLLLPLHAAAFGVTLAEAGLLLAANRLVRIIGYGWVARFYERRGARDACLLAVLAAAVASLGYALLPGLWWLLPMRLLWGLAFAAMNIATQALATVEASRAARRNGTARAIIATGPMIGLILGAVLAELAGPHVVFLGLAAVSLCALPIAWGLPRGEGARVGGGPRFALPAALDVWSFVQGLALDGLFVLGLAALAARYLAEILLGPMAGRIAERTGAAPLLQAVSLGSAAGLVVMGAGWLWVGSALVVGLRGLLQPLPAPVAAARAAPENRVAGLARLATWRDIRTGVGPILAGLLLPVVATLPLYAGAAALLVAASVAALGRGTRG